MELEVHAIFGLELELLTFLLENVFFQKVFSVVVKDFGDRCIKQSKSKQKHKQKGGLNTDKIKNARWLNIIGLSHFC